MLFKRLHFAIIVTIFSTALLAQEIAVPVSVQYPLILKILTFDRNLRARSKGQVVIGLLYQAKVKSSNKVKNELARVINEYPIKSIDDLPVSYCLIDASNELALESIILKNKINVLYLTPLRVLGMETVSKISRNHKVITVTGVPEYVESGVSVGIGIKGANPQILINLSAAKAEGIDFSSQLLKLAKVIE